MAFVAEPITASGGAPPMAAASEPAKVDRSIPAPVLRRVRLMVAIIITVAVIDAILYLPRLLAP